MENTLLECRNLSKEFIKDNNRISVLNNINLRLLKGKLTCIYGRSGAGKSVLLSLLSGIDKASSGEIIYKNESFSELTQKELRRLRSKDISVIFQNFNLISYWNALENVEAAVTDNNCLYSPQELLKELGLSKRLKNYPSELSIGEQQRVAFARAIIKSPTLIIADEPTGEVDEETAELLLIILRKEMLNNGTTILAATHGHFPLDESDIIYELNNKSLISIPPTTNNLKTSKIMF